MISGVLDKRCTHTQRPLLYAAVLLFWGGGFLGAQTGLGMHPGADLAALSRKGAVVLDYSVDKKTDTDWLDFSVNMHGVSAHSLETLRETLRDYQDYPRAFKRCLGASVRETGAAPSVNFALGIRMFGFNLATPYFCTASEPVNTEDAYGLRYSQREDFSQLDGVSGEWYLRRVEIAGKSWTYYRFLGAGSIVIKYPFQEWVMTSFGQGEFRELGNQLLRAAVRRNKSRL
jgi:hypothetical protein